MRSTTPHAKHKACSNSRSTRCRTGSVVSYTFVGESEANILEGKLAMTTPIGKALMGHRKGEIVDVTVPSGVIQFEILEISI